MRLTEKDKIKELMTFQKHNVLMTENEYKELKLGQLEDIEEELGIDLITLFKAIYEGIYVKTKNGISKHYTVSLRKWFQTNTYCLYYRPYTHIWFKDYGKTWALTKEELL